MGRLAPSRRGREVKTDYSAISMSGAVSNRARPTIAATVFFTAKFNQAKDNVPDPVAP